jgi:D-alanine transaminase
MVSMSLIYVNGKVVPVQKARISAVDRGFLFGDAVYEVIKVADGVPLFFGHHLLRLTHSLKEAGIPSPGDLVPAVLKYLEKLGDRSGSLYLEISRGAHLRRHLPPAGLKPTVVFFLQDHHFHTLKEREKGYTVHAMRDIRWKRCDIKAASLMGAILCKLEAHDRNCQEVLFHDARGRFTEAGSTNFYAIRGRTIFTHPLGGAILKGVTRTLLKEIAKELGLRWSERAPRSRDIGTWDEAFVSGTLTGIMPVVAIDTKRISRGMGPVTRRLLAAFRKKEAEAMAAWAGEEARLRLAFAGKKFRV